MAAAAVFACQIWARSTVVRREILPATSSGGGAPPWPARVENGWTVTPPMAKTVWSKMGRNDLVRCSWFWGVFSRVLELKMGVLGLGFYLALKTRFI